MALGLLLLAGAELFARLGLGLGDPPLVMEDPACGYRFAPNQSVQRFGNAVSYDCDSVRAGEESSRCEGKNCCRVLAIGDSVLNGGSLTSDEDTAAGLLNDLHFRSGGRELCFANLSAGSWAPPQQLGYLKAYGTLNCELAMIVISSHDALGRIEGDTPPFPTLKPWLALEELTLRYMLGMRRHLWATTDGWKAGAVDLPEDVEHDSEPTAVSLWCLREMVALFSQNGIPVAAVLWPTRSECLVTSWNPEMERIRGVFDESGVPSVDLLDEISALPDFASTLYRDGIHPSREGQRILSGALLNAALISAKNLR